MRFELVQFSMDQYPRTSPFIGSSVVVGLSRGKVLVDLVLYPEVSVSVEGMASGRMVV